jgi:hypothetical protein
MANFGFQLMKEEGMQNIQGSVNVANTVPIAQPVVIDITKPVEVYTNISDPEVKVQAVSVAKEMNTSEVYKHWNIWEFTIPAGAKILSIDFTISTSQIPTDPHSTHIKLQVVDGLYDHDQVVDDTKIRTDIIAQVDCAGYASTTESYSMHGYMVKDKLRLGVHADNMQDHMVAFHSSCTIFYIEPRQITP